VRRVEDLTLPLLQRYVDEVVTVNETEISHAILLLLEVEKPVVEGAGAATLPPHFWTALLGLRNQKVVLLLSAGNIDVNIISHVIGKSLVQEWRVARVSLIVPDLPRTILTLQRLRNQFSGFFQK